MEFSYNVLWLAIVALAVIGAMAVLMNALSEKTAPVPKTPAQKSQIPDLPQPSIPSQPPPVEPVGLTCDCVNTGFRDLGIAGGQVDGPLNIGDGSYTMLGNN